MNTSDLKNIFPELKTGVKLGELATFGVGGVAKHLLMVTSSEDLVEVIKEAGKNRVPYLVFAGGSNMVFSDEPSDILYICYRTNEKKADVIRITENTIKVEAGLPLSFLINQAVKAGLGGLEALSGIPGTVGGAVVGNAGAYGQSISDKLTAVEIFDGQETKSLSKTECDFKYRDSALKKSRDLLVLSATFNLEPDDKEELEKTSTKIIEVRNKKYQPGLLCPGSFFKNVLIKDVKKESLKFIPEKVIIDGKIPAGFLLEAVEAKGLKEGGVEVADFHGNLIFNTGAGKFTDVIKLSTELKKRVKDKFDINLEEEVRLVE